MEQVKQNQEIIDLKNLKGGLEILVQLAERGEIDPWDVDIIEVTNKYLAALNSTPRENLLNAGRTIFYASVLLRLKSDILLNISNETLLASQQQENFFPEDELLYDQDGVRLDLTRLESYLIRSSIGKQQRKRKISLGDLIFALQQAEEEEDRRALRAKLKAERAFTIAPTEAPDDVFEIADSDEIEDILEQTEAIIEEHLTDEKPITLSFLGEILNNKLKPFLALLFLAYSQKVVLEQKEFYDEVFIHKGGTILKEPREQKDATAEMQKKQKHKKRKKKNRVLKDLEDKVKRGQCKDVEESKQIKEIKELPVIVDIKEIESEVTNNGNLN